MNEAGEIANTVLLIEAGCKNATASGVSPSEGTSKETLARVTTAKCFRCNREGHKASEKEKCRAVTQTCNSCGHRGHFSGSKFCKQTKKPRRNYRQSKGRKLSNTKGNQNQKEEGAEDEDETSSHSVTFLCAISNTGGDETPKCVAEVLGKKIPLLIDSGAVANIVSRKIYELIKDKVVLEKPSKTLYAFGQSKPLNIRGQFHAVIKVNDKSVKASNISKDR